MIEKIASLLRSTEMKWFLAVLWFVVFSGTALTSLGEAPTYVPVVYYFIFWTVLIITLCAVSFAEREDSDDETL